MPASANSSRTSSSSRTDLPTHVRCAIAVREVRREISERYGEKKLYEGGLSVRTTLDPKLQVVARKTLVDHLVKFDEAQGWRGPVAKIALAGDYRYTTSDAQWAVLEGKWGLIPDMSGVQSLKELVGIDVAKKLTMTAEMVSGDRAVELGLASEVSDDPLAAAMDLAHELTTKSPDQLAAAKRLFNRSWNTSARTTFRRERAEQALLLIAQNTAKARKVAMAKAGARAEARAAVKYSPRVLP
mgnify:CR=1 FL=1